MRMIRLTVDLLEGLSYCSVAIKVLFQMRVSNIINTHNWALSFQHVNNIVNNYANNYRANNLEFLPEHYPALHSARRFEHVKMPFRCFTGCARCRRVRVGSRIG